MRGGGGLGRKRPTTGGGDGGGTAADLFTPGQDGNFNWNSTTPIGSKPILLYVFNGHIYEGSVFEYSKSLELGLFKDKEIVKEARDFTCEKICLSDHEFLRKVKGREPVTDFLARTMEKADKRKVSLLFLDSSGFPIANFTDPKAIKEGSPALLKAMRAAKEENSKRLAAAAAKPVEPKAGEPKADAPKSGG
jgi:hypothetical protein